MPDLTESLITFIGGAITAAFPAAEVFVGEVIPQNVEEDFVWLGQAGESTTDDLCDEVDQVRFDVEIVAADIADARQWTAAVKAAIRAADKFAAAWNGLAQFATVEDHDDSYTPRNPEADSSDDLHIGTLAVVFHC